MLFGLAIHKWQQRKWKKILIRGTITNIRNPHSKDKKWKKIEGICVVEKAIPHDLAAVVAQAGPRTFLNLSNALLDEFYRVYTY